MPEAEAITPSRKRAISLALKHYTKEQIITAFKKARDSDFLHGTGSNGWIAHFDWIIVPENLQKLLEDTYRNTPKKKNGFNNFNQRSYDYDSLEKILISTTVS